MKAEFIYLLTLCGLTTSLEVRSEIRTHRKNLEEGTGEVDKLSEETENTGYPLPDRNQEHEIENEFEYTVYPHAGGTQATAGDVEIIDELEEAADPHAEKDNGDLLDEAEEIAGNPHTNAPDSQTKDTHQLLHPALDLYIAAVANGDIADTFGSNRHTYTPNNYKEFGRRFVFQYPYTHIINSPGADPNQEAAEKLDIAVKKVTNSDSKESKDEKLKFVKASPEFVLTVAKQSVMLEASKPSNPTDHVIKQNILRSGDFWDGVWVENEQAPAPALRTGGDPHFSKKSQIPKIQTIKVDISPGSKLYKLAAMTKDISPRLLYIMNSHDDNNKKHY